MCLDKRALERDAVLQLAKAKPTRSRHITQWAFDSIIQVIPNPCAQASLERRQQKDSSTYVSLVYSRVSPKTAPARRQAELCQQQKRRMSEKQFLFFNVGIS